jgi:hypothetical protein
MAKSKNIRWPGHVAQVGERRNACRLSVGKPEGIGRPRCRWVDNIKMVLRDIGLTGTN